MAENHPYGEGLIEENWTIKAVHIAFTEGNVNEDITLTKCKLAYEKCIRPSDRARIFHELEEYCFHRPKPVHDQCNEPLSRSLLIRKPGPSARRSHQLVHLLLPT